MAGLSLFLFNLLPISMLDGGQLLTEILSLGKNDTNNDVELGRVLSPRNEMEVRGRRHRTAEAIHKATIGLMALSLVLGLLAHITHN